jgi:hypothetical protein
MATFSNVLPGCRESAPGSHVEHALVLAERSSLN